MTDLAAIFAEQRASQIDWNGPLFSLYELPNEAEHVTVEFRSVGSELRQGVRLKMRGGQLKIDDAEAAEFVLWQDTAPSRVEVDIAWTSTGERSLRIWNCWERGGVMHAWLGNSGMRVDDQGGGRYLFRCSDGAGEPNFDDLVVSVTAR